MWLFDSSYLLMDGENIDRVMNNCYEVKKLLIWILFGTSIPHTPIVYSPRALHSILYPGKRFALSYILLPAEEPMAPLGGATPVQWGPAAWAAR